MYMCGNLVKCKTSTTVGLSSLLTFYARVWMCVTTHNCSSQAEVTLTETPKSCTLARYSLLVFKRLHDVSHIFGRLQFCPSISSPAFSTPCNVVHHFPVLHFPALHFCPSFSSPAFSSPALLSVIFQSCKFQPCTFVCHYPVLHFPVLQIQSSRERAPP